MRIVEKISKLPLELAARFGWPDFNFSPADLEKKYRHLLILVAITAITYGLVGLGYDVLSLTLVKTKKARPAVAEALPAGAYVKEPADVFAIVAQRNLFGSTDKAVATKTTEAAAPVAGPDLSTLLEIRGTIAGTGKDGFAVIEEKGTNKQVLYKVGSVVAGAKVTLITRNTVTFMIGNQEKVLKMAEAKTGPLLPARPAVPGPAVVPGGSPMVISRSEIEAQLRDMGTMLSQAQIRPYYSEGVPDGFIITNIRPGSIYEKIGLTEGDVVQAANDRKLATADDVTAFYNTMKAGSSLTLKIKRGGREQNLQYLFR